MRAAGVWPDRLVLERLDRWAAETPERLAIVGTSSLTGQRTALTYAELGRRVDRIAFNLARLGMERNDVVSYQSPNWWEFVALHFALLRIGAISNPLMPIFRARELRFMLGLAESKLFIVPRAFRGFDHAPMAEALRPDLPALERILVVDGAGADRFEALWETSADPAATRALFGTRRPGPDDVVQILYTSGTTGEPKGVLHTPNTLLAALLPYAERFGLGQRDVVLMASPIAHQTGFLYGIMMPIWLGGTLVLQDVWDPQRALDLIAAEGVTFTMGATPFLADLATAAETRRADVASLRTFLSAGAPIPRALVRRATEALGANIISAWGMTENGAVTTTKPGDPPEKTFETDGCPIRGMEIRTVDAEGTPLPPGAEGRLQARGATNFVGYLKRPEWFAMDAEGWFETGDLARIDADGYVRITGRLKDVIIRGGENIPVVEVEGLIYRHPAVREAAVVAMPDPRLGERACAFLTLREGTALGFAELARFLEDQGLARSYWPERLEVLPELPKTPSGKIQKNELRALARSLRPPGPDAARATAS
jgi:cyclohexanecarboxylate-CoA ligase